MLVFYHRTGLEVMPGKQVTYAIIIAYIVFKTVRQKFIYFNFHHVLRGETLYCSNTCVLTFVIFFSKWFFLYNFVFQEVSLKSF